MPTVQVTGPGSITGTKEMNGETFYGWTFPVVVDGQAGVYTIYASTNDPAAAEGLIPFVIEDLTADPGALEGIGQNDPGMGDSDRSDGDRGDGDEVVADAGDDDDGAVADGGGDTGAGDSV